MLEGDWEPRSCQEGESAPGSRLVFNALSRHWRGPEDHKEGQEAWFAARIASLYWIDRRLNGLPGPDYDATISFGLPFEPEDPQNGKSRLSKVVDLNPGQRPQGSSAPSIYGFYADVSPDGSQIVYSTCEYSIDVLPSGKVNVYEIAVVNIDGTERRRLTNSPEFEGYPVWSPDGTRIAFMANHRPFWDWRSSSVLAMAEDGSQVRELPNPATGIRIAPPLWSPDGQFLASVGTDKQTGERILYTVEVDSLEVGLVVELDQWVGNPWSDGEQFLAYSGVGDRENQGVYVVRPDGTDLRMVAETERLYGMSWSPDGQFLAFGGREGQVAGIYVVRPDGTDLQQVVDGLIGYPGYWSPDGSKILIFASSGGLYVVGSGGSNLRQLDLSDPEVTYKIVRWSPDGSRIAVLGEIPENVRLPGIPSRRDEARMVVLTVDSDGMAQRILAIGSAAENRDRRNPGKSLRASNLPKPQTQADVAVCSAGFVVQEPEANPGLVRDCETLLGVRNTLAGGAEHIQIDLWEGVNLGGSPPRVHYLDISNRGLTGTIPPELGRLTELRSLSLADWGDDSPNALTGPIPRELGELRELETLFLSYNDLSGSIPPELGRLKNLQKLLLDSNQLTGPVPPEFGGLTKLSWLDLSGNRLSGSIPRELAGLQELDRLPLRLILEGNNLSGCIPAELPEIWVQQSGLERCEPKEAKSP